MLSNFTIGTPFAATWNYRELPVDNICATQGAGFLERLYAAVNVQPMLAWGSELQAALIAKASLLAQASASPPAWLPLLNQLRSDLASTRTSKAGHEFGIYVAYYLAANRRLDAISLPAGTVLLQWGVPPEDDHGLNGGAPVCIDPANDLPFTTSNAAEIAAALNESTTGIRVGEGRPTPPGQNTLSNPAVIGIGGLLVVGLVGAGAWWLLGRADRAERTNPNYTREEIEAMRECRERCAFKTLSLGVESK